MKLVLVGSSPDAGLLYHPVRQAIALRKMGVDVVVATRGGKALSPTLFDNLKVADVPHWESPVLEHGGGPGPFGWGAGGRRAPGELEPRNPLVFWPLCLFSFRV